MKKTFPESKPSHRTAWLLAACTATLLSACGGGSGDDSTAASPQLAPQLASGTITLALDATALPDAVAQQDAQPAFHVAPALLDAPDDTSARSGPHRHLLSAEFAGLSSRRLTVQGLEAAHRRHAGIDLAAGTSAAPMASGSAIATYTPAQIRAAYGLSALPAAGSTLSAAQAAQLGAGQTIYIVDALHDPSVAAELAAFNLKFALPTCTARTIAAGSSLPLAAAASAGCELAIVYNTASGALSSTAPAYDAGWATEITLDVQWAHATAPLARIILIEAPDASLNSLLGAVKLANSMGPGVVSMSFGSPEGNWTASVDATFTATGMSYLAATGDAGAAVSWPAVSPNVVAVGGTTLTYSGSGTRSEVSWSGTGGGTSLYTATPAYQSNAVPGLGTVAHRTVADVAFNADPASGQYVAVLTPGNATVNWLSAGGTSLSTPQWAGLIAIANATRALNAKPALGAPHAMLYGQIASVPGTYASVFADVTKGTDGSCSTCSARTGYDPLSGLGTPNAASLLSALSGTAAAATAPVVTPASIAGKVGTALTFTVSATSANPLSYTLSGAPAGMSIAGSGAVSWATPVAGTWAVTVTASDSKTGLSGQGLYSIVIAAQAAPAAAPVVAAASISGTAGSPLAFSVAVTAPNAVTYALSGAPSGMSIASNGAVSWAKPVAGTWAVTVIATDSKTGLSGQGVSTVKIGASGPVITAPAMRGVAGTALSGTIAISDSAASSFSVSISGVPMGMTFSISGTVVTARWTSPILGNYNLAVSVQDSAGLSTQAVVPVTIVAQ